MMRSKKILITMLIVGLAAAVAFLSFRDTEKGESARDDAGTSHLVDATGKPVDFSSFRGKAVFVNNWASWCRPCVAEMPTIQTLKNKVKGGEVVFVMVSFDEDKEKAHAFMEKNGFDFDVYFPGDDYPYTTTSIPATFILDPSGKVIREHTGMADYSDDDLAEQLKALSHE